MGQYRRQAVKTYENFEFFKPDNEEAMRIRKYVRTDSSKRLDDALKKSHRRALLCRACAAAALRDVATYFASDQGHVAVSRTNVQVLTHATEVHSCRHTAETL